MSEKQKIAILGTFPAWVVDSSLSSSGRHYAVWLVSLYHILENVADRYEIHWITTSRQISRTRHIESKRQHFHILPGSSLKLGQMTHYLRERFLIGRQLRRIRPDIVHAWGTEYFYALAAKDFKGKKLLSMQGVLTAYCDRAPMPPFMIKQSKFERACLKDFQHISTESVWAAERCREIAPSATIHLWDYAANEQFFHTTYQPGKAPVCLAAGTDTPIKNLHCAIEAFSKPELSHIKLYLAGAEARHYTNLPPNIVPLGRVGREQMQELLSSAWALVHPSLADSCPNIVKEARVVGVPCIVTEDCGAKQYVVHGKSGYVIPVHNSEALAQAVLKITSSRENAMSMGAHDQSRCREALSASTMSKELLRLYSTILAE